MKLVLVLVLALVLALAGCWRGSEREPSPTSEPSLKNEASPRRRSPDPWRVSSHPPPPDASIAVVAPPPVAAPPNPACNVHLQQAQHFVSVGQHANALVSFDAAIACDPHPYYLQMAFMTSCAAGNSSKAKQYYKQLTPAQQTKFAQICIRQKPPVAYQ